MELSITMLRLAIVILLWPPMMLTAQLNHVGHEVYYEDDGTVDGYPEGFKTWNVYAYLENAGDYLFSCWANNGHEMTLGSSTNVIWNHSDGAITGGDLDPVWWPMWDALPYDSYITIGRRSVEEAGEDIYIVDLFGDIEAAFHSQSFPDELDENLELEEGAWFIYDNNENGYGDYEDGLYRVLLAQITTDGELVYSLNIQVEPEFGDLIDYVADPTNIEDGQTDGSGLGLIYPVPGCLDPPPANDLVSNAEALAFDQETTGTTCCATFDESLCNEESNLGVWYHVNSGDCDDISFVLTNLNGTNVGMTIWEDNGGLTEIACCPMIDEVCAGSLGAFNLVLPNTDYYFMPSVTNLDNCGEFSLVVSCEVVGCTEPTSCNYDPEATIDDGSCIFGNLPNDEFDNAQSLEAVLDFGCESFNFCFSTDSPEWPGMIDMWYSIDVDFESVFLTFNGEVDLILGLFDPDGNLLQEIDADFTTEELLSITDPQFDTYFIGVSSWNNPPQGILEICAEIGPIEGDLNGDGIVDINDLLDLLGQLGCQLDCTGDLDGDGLVTIWDLLIMLGLL
jgi:hypothetical protein